MIGRLVRWAVAIALVGAFAAFVWPTRWRYDHMTVDGDIVPVRIDRFSGDADMLLPDDGWVPVEAPEGGATQSPTARVD